MDVGASIVQYIASAMYIRTYVIYKVRPLGGHGIVHCMMMWPISRWYSYAMDTPYMAYMCVCIGVHRSPYSYLEVSRGHLDHL